MNFSVFYAWQSDRDEAANRYLIRDAAKAAIKKIVKDSEIEDSPRLDHDTKDVPGLAEVAGTIFRKIENCGLFLADLTFVGSSAGREGKESKPLPNANVVLELGYAARSVGWERVIAVMNTAHGEASQMIFDVLHRRWPITYELDDGAEITTELKTALAGKIELWIRGAMNSLHAGVEEAIKSLDLDSLEIMASAGAGDYFSLPTTIEGGIFGLVIHSDRKAAVKRLIDLRLLEAKFDPIQYRYSYDWTYFGKLALTRLGIRKPAGSLLMEPSSQVSS